MLAAIDDPATMRLRASLSGDMVGGAARFRRPRETGRTIYAALYELGDDELITALEALGKKLHIVLSNSEGERTSRARRRKPTATQ